MHWLVDRDAIIYADASTGYLTGYYYSRHTSKFSRQVRNRTNHPDFCDMIFEAFRMRVFKIDWVVNENNIKMIRHDMQGDYDPNRRYYILTFGKSPLVMKVDNQTIEIEGMCLRKVITELNGCSISLLEIKLTNYNR